MLMIAESQIKTYLRTYKKNIKAFAIATIIVFQKNIIY